NSGTARSFRRPPREKAEQNCVHDMDERPVMFADGMAIQGIPGGEHRETCEYDCSLWSAMDHSTALTISMIPHHITAEPPRIISAHTRGEYRSGASLRARERVRIRRPFSVRTGS